MLYTDIVIRNTHHSATATHASHKRMTCIVFELTTRKTTIETDCRVGGRSASITAREKEEKDDQTMTITSRLHSLWVAVV